MELITSGKTFWDLFIQLVKAPSHHPEMNWIVAPLIVVLFLMTIYFAKHQGEELGWNTALGNSLILIFVALDLLRALYTRTDPASLYNFSHNLGTLLLIGLLFVGGIVLMFVNFTHFLPKKIAYLLSSPLAINLTAYVIIAFVYSQMQLTIVAIIAMILLLAVLLGTFLGFGYVSRRWWERVEKLKQRQDVEDVKKEQKELQKTKQLVQEKEKKIKQAVIKTVKEEKAGHEKVKKIKKIIPKKLVGNNHAHSKSKKARKGK